MTPVRKAACAAFGQFSAFCMVLALSAAPADSLAQGASRICSGSKVRYVVLPRALRAALPDKPAPEDRHQLACAHATCSREVLVVERRARR